ALIVECNATVLFNVNFGFSSEEPILSDEGGGFPAPIGIPTVTSLTANPSNATHPGNILDQTLWMESYSDGDYFSFQLFAEPGQQIRMKSIWYGVATDASDGPGSVIVDFMSIGGSVSQQIASGTFGLEFFDVLSDTSAAEIRISGFGGAGDFGAGPHESFGIQSIAGFFEVIPEPSVSALLILVGAVGVL
ncbi:hypothetical protein N9195_02840, partial [bacterium]|nr:hypothetical protein [bacterium]